MEQEQLIRVRMHDMQQQFSTVLLKYGFTAVKAETLSQVFAENSLDGVYTHGVNRFSRFIQYVQQGHVQKDNEPSLVHAFGVIEQWNGNGGPGILNALQCTERAMAIATGNGIGMVGLANTNHWMRGGTYGWHAAKKGFALISWTNTISVMPSWGATEAKLGNNPLVFAIPYHDEAIVLDMAMSQFSYGKMEMKAMRGESLEVPGGFDAQGNVTTDAAAILASKRPMPIGYWKGAALALLLDVFAAILSAGQATKAISASAVETNVSQVFIAIDLSKLHNYSSIAAALHSIVEDYKTASALGDGALRYPGEGVVRTRKENLEKGIPVDKEVWENIQNL
ncbi:3-dehydro-L-gulonate 2-dehydrogenase [Aridibaculum aurantiacum]|uniref:3-dehydro-L-gulonate 2-dehydrogenase n=1 Tax=Aridibaculum aurantiacum TaxID=2810307 RepID=UPI001A95C119|nr:3-dehydro-L-gulonate 2-dehydrogenase [Aridibaculum aurantiacum]